MAGTRSDLEILVLDNASSDNTPEVISAIQDSRVKYHRSESRLSMRDNFERGLELARGDVICFIGDDDGLMPKAADQVLALFSQNEVDAVSAARAHYFWPDLLSARRNTALLPRHAGSVVLDAKSELFQLLDDCDYYRLPCLYHGFVRRSIVDHIRKRQGRFFLSSQVDMFSSIALSMEGIKFILSQSPLVINGASARSNGASHFGGGTGTEKSLWKQEDELGFLPGFEASLTVGSLIVESALRYCQGNGALDVFSVLGREHIENALASEASKRRAAGRLPAETFQVYATVGIPKHDSAATEPAARTWVPARAAQLARSFASTRPIDMNLHEVSDVFGASQVLDGLLSAGQRGIGHRPFAQFAAALRLARG